MPSCLLPNKAARFPCFFHKKILIFRRLCGFFFTLSIVSKKIRNFTIINRRFFMRFPENTIFHEK